LGLTFKKLDQLTDFLHRTLTKRQQCTKASTVRIMREISRQPKGAITSKIKHVIKHKISPARLAQLLQDWTVRRHWLQAKTKC